MIYWYYWRYCWNYRIYVPITYYMANFILGRILDVPEIAIVDREAELPPIRYLGSEYVRGYVQAQQDMLKTGWVKEVKG